MLYGTEAHLKAVTSGNVLIIDYVCDSIIVECRHSILFLAEMELFILETSQSGWTRSELHSWKYWTDIELHQTLGRYNDGVVQVSLFFIYSQ